MLPADLWPQIAATFTQGEALRLMLLGCRALSSKLRSSVRDLKFVWFRSEYADWSQCLKSLDNFSHPERVSLSSNWDNHLSVWPVTWQLLHPRLKSLSLRFRQSVAALFVDDSVFDRWPNLEDLRVEDSTNHGTSGLLSQLSLKRLPPTLQTLYIHSTLILTASARELESLPTLLRIFDTNVQFARYLSEMEDRFVTTSFVVWPASLEKLVLNLANSLVDTALLPRSLTHLELSARTEIVQQDWINFSWTVLFPRLRTFIVPSVMSKAAFQLVVCNDDRPSPAFFPSTLTELKIEPGMLPFGTEHFFSPEALVHAYEDLLEDGEGEARPYPRRRGVLSQLHSIVLDLPHQQLSESNIHACPQLTSVQILLWNNIGDVWPLKLTSLTVDRLAELDCTHLPRTLTALNAIGLATPIARDDRFQLPPKLTSIRLERCHPRILLAFPPTIRKLDVPLPEEADWQALNSRRDDGSAPRFPFLEELHVHDVPEFSSAVLIPDSIHVFSARLRLSFEAFPYHPWWRSGFSTKSKIRKVSFRGPVPLDVLLHLPTRLEALEIEKLEQAITEDVYIEALPRNLRSLRIRSTRSSPRSISALLFDIPPPICVDALSSLPDTLTCLDLQEYADATSELPPIPIWALPRHLSLITHQVSPDYMNRYGELRSILSEDCDETFIAFGGRRRSLHSSDE